MSEELDTIPERSNIPGPSKVYVSMVANYMSGIVAATNSAMQSCILARNNDATGRVTLLARYPAKAGEDYVEREQTSGGRTFPRVLNMVLFGAPLGNDGRGWERIRQVEDDGQNAGKPDLGLSTDFRSKIASEFYNSSISGEPEPVLFVICEDYPATELLSRLIKHVNNPSLVYEQLENLEIAEDTPRLLAG